MSHVSSKDAIAFCLGKVGKDILKLEKSFAFAPGCAERALIPSIKFLQYADCKTQLMKNGYAMLCFNLQRIRYEANTEGTFDLII